MAKIVDVAVGLIVQHGQALIAWRNGQQHQGERYEFAGGKVDLGETPQQALLRELREELGIVVRQSRFLQRLTYHYPEKTVCLHVFWVSQFDGVPVGQEGQPLCWVALEDLKSYRFPDANTPIVRAAQLPCHYTISTDLGSTDLGSTNLEHQPIETWLAQQKKLPAHAWLYVRLPRCDVAQQTEMLCALASLRPDLKLVASADLSHVADLPVCGFHLRQNQLMACTQLPRQHNGQYWFAACHDVAALQQAERLGVDAVTLGAVLPTPTHPDQLGLGWAVFAQWAQQAAMPVYALGGLRPADLALAQQHGAHGVAGIRHFYP